MIAALDRCHVRAVAALHVQSLSGLLVALGERAVRQYYEGLLASGLGVALVAVAGGEVRGFVAGAVDPARVRRAMARSRPARLCLAVAWGALRRPSALRWLAQSLGGKVTGSFDTGAPELTYLAVARGARGSGTGRELVDAFAAELRRRGADSYELSVEAENSGAVAFYERLGFTRVGRYREFDRDYLRLRSGTLPQGQ